MVHCIGAGDGWDCVVIGFSGMKQAVYDYSTFFIFSLHYLFFFFFFFFFRGRGVFG